MWWGWGAQGGNKEIFRVLDASSQPFQPTFSPAAQACGTGWVRAAVKAKRGCGLVGLPRMGGARGQGATARCSFRLGRGWILLSQTDF